MKSKKHCLLFPAVLLVLVTAIAGCGMEEIFSGWCDRPVTIDGIDNGTEWNGALHSFPKANVTVGILNDEKMLYLRLSTRNRAVQRQIETAGLTLWFDETGGQKQTYGVRLPLPERNGATDSKPDMSRDMDSKRGPAPEQTGTKPMDRPQRPDRPRVISQGEIEITRPGENEHSRISADDPSPLGVGCRMGQAQGSLVYELRIPLIRDKHSYHGLATSKPKTIGIGLVTGKDEQPRRDMGGGGRGDGRGPGGPGGGMQGMGQPPGGGGMNGPREEATPIDLWLKVHMAEAPRS